MKTALIGLGNPIVGDDAIGINTVEYIKNNYTFPKDIEIMIDVSLAGIGLVELFRGFEKVIIVDSMQSGKYQPGTVVKLHPDQFESALHISDYHNMDFFTAYKFGKEIYEDIPENDNIILLGIEIDYVQEFSDKLTPQIQKQFNKIVNHVYQEIKKEINKNKEIMSNVL